MFDFTNRVKKVINEYAPKEAKRLGHEYLGPEHILLGLFKATDSVAIKILSNLNINIDEIKQEIEKRCDQDSMTIWVDPTSSDKIQKILEFSREEARNLRHSYIGTEHILLAILRDSTSIASMALASFSITYQVVKNSLHESIGISSNYTASQKTSPNNPPKKQISKNPTLEEYARNLNKLVEGNSIDPVIGRDKEIERLIQTLSRKTKNNPILVGEAGVGKTAIVEGLAQRILKKEVPESLFNAIIYSLDVAALIAGTKYRGEFEDRLKRIMKEIRGNKDIILFIDEIHIIIGAGAAEGSVDAANILKPALARSEVQCIGATTVKEYKKYIQKDSALERRFQSISVEEPSVQDTIRILFGLRKNYENFHNIQYTKDSIQLAVQLTHRFITDRHLPDKAIDLLDEAGARVRLKQGFIPENLKSKESDILKLTRDKNEMVRLQQYEKAAELRDNIEKLKKDYNLQLENWKKKQKEKPVLIKDDDIMQVMVDWTGIPVRQLQISELKRLSTLEVELGEKIIGQPRAISKITKAVQRSKTGFKAANKPIGSFIFLGPTGVGKTQLAKVLSEFLFGAKNSLVRFDMSEFMELHAVSKFIGSPPGYVGYDEGGQLTEAVRKKPHCVVLFDEIEKAHPDIQNILLQILDDGELTEATGRKISFKETIIVMTSNIGARHLFTNTKLGFSSALEKNVTKDDLVIEELRKHFNPEFLNRVDDIVIFDSLSEENVTSIVDIMMEDINKYTIQKNISVQLSTSAKKYLAKKGYDKKYGARPLRRVLQTEIEDMLSTKTINGELEHPSEVQVNCTNDSLQFKIIPLTSKKLKALKDKYHPENESIDVYWNEFEEKNKKSSKKKEDSNVEKVTTNF